MNCMATPAPKQSAVLTGTPLTATLISVDNYAFLQRHIYAASGIVLDSGKHYLLESRLIPIVRKEQLGSLDELCRCLRAGTSPRLQEQVTEAMTTNETLFFRDSAPFDAMRSHIVPKLLELRKDTRKLRFWSAASSSGQEPYSLAMLLLEMGLGNWQIEILGTDLSGQILERARTGKFMQIEVNRGLPAPYLIKYFRREGLDWQLKDEVLKMVKFQRFDLRQSMSGLGPFDVVFCRNVLIYFDVETKKTILAKIRSTIVPGGHLILGGAETTLNLDDNFKRTQVGQAIFYQAP
jgi:chemotaxis protein methyltransferase CheR